MYDQLGRAAGSFPLLNSLAFTSFLRSLHRISHVVGNGVEQYPNTSMPGQTSLGAFYLHRGVQRRARGVLVNLAEEKPEEEIKRVGTQGTPGFKVNTEITASKVRLVMDDGTHKICPLREALQTAKHQGLDLVEVSASSDPPACRMMNYAQFQSNKRKAEREAAKKMAARQREDTVKEMRFSARTAENDQEMKITNIEKFLIKGRKVKVSIDLKGELVMKRGHIILQQIMAKVGPIAKLEGPTRDGQTMFAWIIPTKDASKAIKSSAAPS